MRLKSRVWRTRYGRKRETIWSYEDKVEIIDRAEHWSIRRLMESAHLFGYTDLLSRPNVELNTIWEPIIKKARWKKKDLNMSTDKKSYNSSNSSQVRT